MDKLVSVVVPVYNTKDYLVKCIRSIINQTHRELEIIIVDDGSTDGSSELCDQLQREDERIVVIHKEQGGVVSARKSGLEKVKSEYTLMVDSDDWIERGMIAKLYEIAVSNQADIVTSGAYREYGDTCAAIVDGVREGVYSGSSKEYIYRNLIFMDGSEQDGILGSLSNKLVRTTLMRELHEKISDEIIMGEDSAITYAACMRAKKIVITHDIFYHYTIRLGSALHKSHPYFLRSTNELYLYLKNEIENNFYRDILFPQLEKYLIFQLFRGINYFLGLNHVDVIPQYDFEKSIIHQNAKIVLYGAGKVGQSYYKQIIADKLYRLEGWIDKNYMHYQEQGMNVLPIESLKEINFDYVILALQYQDMAESIKSGLVDEYKIPADKIVWMKPISILDKYYIKDNQSEIKN